MSCCKVQALQLSAVARQIHSPLRRVLPMSAPVISLLTAARATIYSILTMYQSAAQVQSVSLAAKVAIHSNSTQPKAFQSAATQAKIFSTSATIQTLYILQTLQQLIRFRWLLQTLLTPFFQVTLYFREILSVSAMLQVKTSLLSTVYLYSAAQMQPCWAMLLILLIGRLQPLQAKLQIQLPHNSADNTAMIKGLLHCQA